MSRPVNVASLSPRASFEGKHILLSGTTGFLGKVVLSMLLDRYPDIGRVYALIRPGVSDRARDRFNKTVATSPAMRPLVERYGERIIDFLEEKVVPLDGNVTHEDCGLSPDDLAMLETEGLDLVINSAGLVDFDPPIDNALSINAYGPQNLVALSKRLGASLLHVSTCFVAGRRSGQIIEDEALLDRLPDAEAIGAEEFDHAREIARLTQLADEVRARADDAAQRTEWRAAARAWLEAEGRDPEDPRALKQAILRQRKSWLSKELKRVGMERATFWGWTNTYTFTKSLGEQVIARAVADGQIDACILRPAIVESALEFPFPGWNEGFTTTAPLILLTRNGLPRFPYAEDLVLDIIPVDMVAGAILAAAAALLDGGAHKLVYQASTGDVNPLTVRSAIELTALGGRKYARKQKRTLKNWWLSQNEMEPMAEEDFVRKSIPAYRRIAAQVVRAVDKIGPDRFGWMRQPAGTLRDFAAEVEKGSARVEQVLELFMPFVAQNKYVFRSDNTRHLIGRVVEDERPGLCYEPENFVWRQYWQDVHMPGLEKWVFPKLEKELAEKPKHAYVYRNLVELFETVTHRHRHRIALQYLRKNADEFLTYGQLRTLAFRVAGYLVAHGVEPEDRILLVCENRPEWVAAYFGILLAGATAVPVDAMAKAEEIVNIAKASEARGAIISPRTGRRLVFEGANPAMIAESGAALWLLSEVITHPDELEMSRDPARIASLIFTSGTTGTPKGVMLTHRNFTFEVSRLAGVFKLTTDDHLLSVLPLHHTFEFTAGLLMPLARGSRVTYVSMVTADTLGRAFRQGVTGLIGVPALWQLLHRRIESQLEDAGALPKLIMHGVRAANGFAREYFDVNIGPLAAYPVHKALGGRLRYLVSGGSALSQDVMDFFRGLGFNMSEGYGLTETSPVLTVTNPKEKLAAGSVGKPLSGVDLRIDKPNEDGVGEVLARGPNVMAGYWADPAATDAVMEHEWLRTGDLGRLDEAGRLYLVGRKKDVIVDADGRNVYPDELEEVYGDDPRIEEISIVGLAQGRTERVAALVVADYDGKKSARAREAVRGDIERHIKRVSDGLPYHKRIKILHFWEGELPRTATRKVKRAEVVEILQRLNGSSERVQEVAKNGAADTPVAFVASVVAALAGKEPHAVGPDTRLISDLGFDSLMFVELAGALEEHVIDVSTEQLMSIETVAEIVPLLRRRESVARSQAAAAAVAGRSGSGASGEEEIQVPTPLAQVGKRVLGWGQRRFMKVDIRGKGYIPRHSGFLVAANHTSHLDAGLVKTALGEYGKDIVALAARDYFFGNKIRRAYFEHFTNVLPIERHGSIKQSLRLAVSKLERGATMLIFPEGTRSPDGRMCEFKASLGYLAMSARVPVLPMYLWGTYEAMPKGSTLFPSSRRIGAVIGPAIEPEALDSLTEGMPKGEAYRVATELIEAAVQSLRDQGRYRLDALLQAAKERARPQPTSSPRMLENSEKEKDDARARAAGGNGSARVAGASGAARGGAKKVGTRRKATKRSGAKANPKPKAKPKVKAKVAPKRARGNGSSGRGADAGRATGERDQAGERSGRSTPSRTRSKEVRP